MSASEPPPPSISPSPVRRRESPWGMSGDDHRQPTPHRCNDRAEDVIQCDSVVVVNAVKQRARWGVSEKSENSNIVALAEACFEGNPFKTVPGPFKLFWRCMRSKPGEEPTEPFHFLQLDSPGKEVQLE